MKFLLISCIGLLLSSACAKEKMTRADARYLEIDNALIWLQDQDIGACDERLEFVLIKVHPGSKFAMFGVGYDLSDLDGLDIGEHVQHPIDRTFLINDLSSKTVFNCQGKSGLKTPESLAASATFQEFITSLSEIWRNPECALRVKEYINKTENYFSGRNPISYTLDVSGDINNRSIGIKPSGARHYSSLVCKN